MFTGSEFGAMVGNLLTSGGTLGHLRRALLNGTNYLGKNGTQCVSIILHIQRV
jgi:hypothetical protein